MNPGSVPSVARTTVYISYPITTSPLSKKLDKNNRTIDKDNRSI